MEESDPTEQWSKIKESMLSKGENILGLKQRKEAKDWITEETWEEINRRKITKQKINNADVETKPTLLAQYADINKRVKSYARRYKRAWAEKLAHKTQLAAEGNHLKELYQITRRLAGKPITPQQVGVRDLTGRLLTTPQNQLAKWQEYFKDNFAMPPQQASMNNTQKTPELTKIPIGAPTTNEIKKAIKHLKQNKAAAQTIYQQNSSELIQTP
jgi:hypothetical protein